MFGRNATARLLSMLMTYEISILGEIIGNALRVWTAPHSVFNIERWRRVAMRGGVLSYFVALGFPFIYTAGGLL